jgi:hypothetical protein
MSEWISVDERLPDMHEVYKGSPLTSGYLLIFNGSNVTIGEYEQTFSKRKPRWRSHYGVISVTHWMPFPHGPTEVLEGK